MVIFSHYPQLPECTKISNFLIYHSHDFAVYTQTLSSIIFESLTLVENSLGLLPIVTEPDPLTHLRQEKFVLMKDSVIVICLPEKRNIFIHITDASLLHVMLVGSLEQIFYGLLFEKAIIRIKCIANT